MRVDAVWLGAWLGSVLVGLPIATVSGLRGYSRPCRVVLGTAAGAFLLSTVMTLSALAGIAWRGPVLLGVSIVSAALLRALLSDPSTEESPPRRSPGAGIVLVWLSLGAAFLCVVAGGATSIDLLLFWGPKAQAFAAARAIDVRYLKDPLHAYLHPSYPPLATNLAALATMAARVFPWRLAPITFPIALGGLALGLPGCLRRWLSEREAWALSAVVVSALALLGTETDVGGNADMPLLFFELLAMALLISPDAARPPIQWMAGLLLGSAATTKVEGLPFAVSAAVLFVVVRRDIRPAGAALLRLLSPTAVAVGAWLALGAVRSVFVGYRGYGEFGRLYLRSLPAVVNAIGGSLWAAGYGLPFLVPLLVLAVGPRPRRLAILPLGVLAALSLFFVFTYLHEADPSQWILWSAARIFSPACGLLVMAAAAGGAARRTGTAWRRPSDRLRLVPKAPFSDKTVLSFADAPAAILIAGDVEFFVEEAAATARAALSDPETEVLVFDDDAPAEAVSDALLNRSLFSPRRLVQLDISRILGTDKPGELFDAAVKAWDSSTPAGRRAAFKAARALLAALDLPPSGNPEENAEAAARKTRRKDEAPLLAEILKELPPESAGAGAILKTALRAVIAREHNDGTVALLTAVNPPSGVDLVKEVEKRGLILQASVGDEPEPSLRRLAGTRAKEREVVLDPAAIERLLKRTDGNAASFASELEKLLEWAGKGGRIRPADVDTNVQDEASEDIYEFFEAVGRREAKDALARLERLFEEGREVSAGDMAVDTIKDWPAKFLGMLTSEVRRMLLIRSRLDEGGPGGFDAQTSYSTFQARVLPRLMAPATPFGRSPFENAQGKPVHPFALYRAAQRSARFTSPQLARALARAAEVDTKLKDSAPVLETLTVYVGELIAGN